MEIGWYCQDCKSFTLDADGIIEDVIKNRLSGIHARIVKERSTIIPKKIYYRSKDKGRQFKAFAKYDIRNKLFRTDEISNLDRARAFRLTHHLPYEVDYVKAYRDADNQFNMMMGEMIVKPETVEWAKQVFDEERKKGHPYSEITEWIRAYAKEKNLTSLAINYLLLKNDVRA